ncbi:thiamine diphosphokinase [Clostridium weizhouense]|uniref:Thiamine diphosphokinase n=1 Tax=Clostridium weizhouense TaxID=2859781 RepID=A0ABS7ANW8_9CLOT|nr:thiamine diphosphokinase [Clostridium weizhouense]MBW6409783.1 thiamine diphosphokinase [Clostridium weizhouense]
MRVIIVSGGNPPSKELLESYIKDADFIIAADKGGECLLNYGITPNLLLGDFDSMKKEVLKELENKVNEVVKYPPEKDFTDTEIAFLESIKRGGDKIYLFGATGTRLDHTLGNIGLLLNAKNKGVYLEIIDNNNRMYLGNKKIKLFGKYGENISFHALSDKVKSLKIKGGRYTLLECDVSLLEPRAICNEFIDTPIEIEYKEGELLILHSFD